jgi:hypothetical protein
LSLDCRPQFLTSRLRWVQVSFFGHLFTFLFFASGYRNIATCCSNLAACACTVAISATGDDHVDREEDRKQPSPVAQGEAVANAGFEIRSSQAPEQAARMVTSAGNRAHAPHDLAVADDETSQQSKDSEQLVDPTPSGPTEPTHHLEVELPANWNENAPAPSGSSGNALQPPSELTEPSHHLRIELPAGWDRNDLKPSDPSNFIAGSPSVSNLHRPAPTPPNASVGSQGDRERLVPSIVVTVSLGHSRDMFEQAVEAAIQHATQKFHKIAKQEIDLFAFEQHAVRRAADYRLRGPNPQ